MYIIYHEDADGCGAATIANLYAIKNNIKTKFQAINYNQKVEYKEIEKNETVLILDFSLQSIKDWESLFKITNDVIWIDHHETSINKWTGVADELKGIREIGKSGCLLTWEYFNPDKIGLPLFVKLINDYDLWKFEFKETTNYFQLGLYLNDLNPNTKFWLDLIIDENCNPVIDNGKICALFRDKQSETLMKNNSFYIDWEGYKCICCNSTIYRNSLIFNSISSSNFDIMIIFAYTNTKNWIVSLYTKSNIIKVNKIAEKYGGGGHSQAAGFITNKLPWEN